jgi:hypothetical protein
MTSVQFGLATVDRDALTAAAMPVDAPALVANPINLVRSSRIPADTTSGRWVNGFAYVPEGVGLLGVGDACSGEFEEMNHQDGFNSDWEPYVLTVEYRCSTFGYTVGDYKARASRLLDAATPKLLEWEFWGGPLAQAAGLNNRYLAMFGGQPIAADTIEEAIGSVENALADCGYGGRGMIHLAPYVVPFLKSIVRREGNLLLTDRDTIVVPGSGYARYGGGSTPNATMDIYGTGITDVRLGDIVVEDDVAIDRATNTVVIKAQRYACVSWDELCQFKVIFTH